MSSKPCSARVEPRRAPGEQNNGDGFHTITLHQSLVDLGMMAGDDDNPTAQMGLNVSANGSGLRCLNFDEFV